MRIRLGDAYTSQAEQAVRDQYRADVSAMEAARARAYAESEAAARADLARSGTTVLGFGLAWVAGVVLLVGGGIYLVVRALRRR